MRHLRNGLLATSLSAALCIGGAVLASAQSTTPPPDPSQPTVNPQAQSPSAAPTSPSTSAPSTVPDQDNGMRPVPNKDDQAQQPMSEQPPQAGDKDRDKSAMSAGPSKKDGKKFDKFLDSHKDIADDLQKDPNRVNDPGYVSSHQDLAKFLDDNPEIREQLKANASAFMNRENKSEKHEDKHQDMQNPQSPQQ